MNLLEDLKWRYAVKQYNTEKVSEDKVQQILEAINLSASSCGLQPYRLIVIENDELRSKLGEGSFNGQILNSSHLLVFAAFNDVTSDHIKDYMDLTAKTREIPLEALSDFSATLNGYFSSRTTEENRIWADKQAYIALGTALIAAAHLKVDATPMEGFDAKKFDELLGLEEKALHSTVILSIGYRDEESDSYASLKKVRLPINDFVLYKP